MATAPSPSRSDGFQKKSLLLFSRQHPAAAAAAAAAAEAAAAGCKSPPFSTPPPLLGCGIRRRHMGSENILQDEPRPSFTNLNFQRYFFLFLCESLSVFSKRLPQWLRRFLARSFAPRSNYTLCRCALPAHFPFYPFIF